MKNNTRHTRQPARRTRQQHRHQSAGVPLKAGIALVAGAAIGGAMMFLFDPKVGATRRRRIGTAAHDAMDQGRDALGAAIGSVASHAGEAAGHLRSHLSDASERMSGMAGDAANSAMAAGSGFIRNAANGMRGYANDAHDQAMDFADSQLRRLGNALPHDREHRYVGQTTCALGSLALGAGAVYFFDPYNGARRRSEFTHRLFKAIQMTGEFCNATGQYLRNKMMGTQPESEVDATPSGDPGSAAPQDAAMQSTA